MRRLERAAMPSSLSPSKLGEHVRFRDDEVEEGEEGGESITRRIQQWGMPKYAQVLSLTRIANDADDTRRGFCWKMLVHKVIRSKLVHPS